jgi:hypothetical protein
MTRVDRNDVAANERSVEAALHGASDYRPDRLPEPGLEARAMARMRRPLHRHRSPMLLLAVCGLALIAAAVRHTTGEGGQKGTVSRQTSRPTAAATQRRSALTGVLREQPPNEGSAGAATRQGRPSRNGAAVAAGAPDHPRRYRHFAMAGRFGPSALHDPAPPIRRADANRRRPGALSTTVKDIARISSVSSARRATPVWQSEVVEVETVGYLGPTRAPAPPLEGDPGASAAVAFPVSTRVTRRRDGLPAEQHTEHTAFYQTQDALNNGSGGKE